MHRTTTAVALFFNFLGGYLIVTAMQLQTSSGSLPGAGFFPQVIGALMILLATTLLWKGIGSEESEFQLENGGAVTGVILLVLGYLLFWDMALFALRTAVFLLLFLRFLGQSWKASAAVTVFLTTTIVFAFQVGLRVSL